DRAPVQDEACRRCLKRYRWTCYGRPCVPNREGSWNVEILNGSAVASQALPNARGGTFKTNAHQSRVTEQSKHCCFQRSQLKRIARMQFRCAGPTLGRGAIVPLTEDDSRKPLYVIRADRFAAGQPYFDRPA